jgi:hypothetical protein
MMALLMSGLRQKAKYSLRAIVFRFAPSNRTSGGRAGMSVQWLGLDYSSGGSCKTRFFNSELCATLNACTRHGATICL